MFARILQSFAASGAAPELTFLDILRLTFEALFEVVIICVAGFMAAKSGLLNTSGQKVLSQLNVDIFTPCLVFIKLAPSLSYKKMADIIIIPVFYVLTTGISYSCSKVVSILFSLNEPESDFVTAMAVFGNSNSLPVSLTLSLAYTLPDLLWDDLEDDTTDKVASRGILYLLIFQQLGLMLRWSWGFNKLLRSRSKQELNTYYNKNGTVIIGVLDNETQELLSDTPPDSRADSSGLYIDSASSPFYKSSPSSSEVHISERHRFNVSPASSSSSENIPEPYATPDHRKGVGKGFSRAWIKREDLNLKAFKDSKLVKGFLQFMNPPLYAMLLSIIVASVPVLQREFFEEQDSFIHNTVTKSISQLGSVSIPLILIVLGSYLNPSKDVPGPSKHFHRILIGSLVSRMILPPLILLPIIALCVKYVKISILDDPIFLIVAFILTVSPPAIQLSQITQLNNIYQKEMASVLFWGYVVFTLPTTIFIVTTSLEVLRWAAKT